MPPERTALAWERTGIALIVAGGLLIKPAIDSGAVWAEGLGLLVVAAGAGVFLWSAQRFQSRRAQLNSGPVTHPVMLRTVASITVVLTLAAIVLVVLSAIT